MIGDLRHRIERLTANDIEDGAGGRARQWSAGPLIWARVERLTSIRDVTGIRAERLRRIAATIRYRSDIKPGDFIRFEAVPYEVVSVEDAPSRSRVTLVCEEMTT